MSGRHFVDAQALWLDERRMEIAALRLGEPRVVVIGPIEGKRWSGVITYCGRRTWLTSVRRSRRGDVAAYES